MSASGQQAYDHAIREFVALVLFGAPPRFNRTVLLRYRIHLEQASRRARDDQPAAGRCPACRLGSRRLDGSEG
jgi:hypothetical protein